MSYTIEHCIVDMLSSMGPQEEYALRAECRDQCSPYTKQLFNNAIVYLCSERTIVVDYSDNEIYYDFPESYYFKQTGFNYDAPYNPEFLGAKPAKAGEDY